MQSIANNLKKAHPHAQTQKEEEKEKAMKL